MIGIGRSEKRTARGYRQPGTRSRNGDHRVKEETALEGRQPGVGVNARDNQREGAKGMEKVNLTEKFARFTEQWSPRSWAN